MHNEVKEEVEGKKVLKILHKVKVKGRFIELHDSQDVVDLSSLSVTNDPSTVFQSASAILNKIN